MTSTHLNFRNMILIANILCFRHVKTISKAQAWHLSFGRKTPNCSTKLLTSTSAPQSVTSAIVSLTTPRKHSSSSLMWSKARLKPSWPYAGVWPINLSSSELDWPDKWASVHPATSRATAKRLLKSLVWQGSASRSCTASPASRVLRCRASKYSLRKWAKLTRASVARLWVRTSLRPARLR